MNFNIYFDTQQLIHINLLTQPMFVLSEIIFSKVCVLFRPTFLFLSAPIKQKITEFIIEPKKEQRK